MSTTRRTPFRSRVMLAVAAALAVLAAPLALAAPAQAHDQLISRESSPRAGSIIDVAPGKITLVFSADLMNLAGSKANQIQVTDRDGKEVTTGDVTVKGEKMSRTLQPLPAGTYDVKWSATSSDGHPIGDLGDYAFTVTKGEKAKASKSEEASSSSKSSSGAAKSSPDVAGTPRDGATQTPAAAQAADQSPTNTVMWIVGGFLVLAILLGIVLQVTRPKQRRGE